MSQPEDQLSPQFESAFEERFYHERLEKLEKIAALGAANGLSKLAAIYPNSFRFQPEGIDVPQIKAQYKNTTTEELEAEKPPFAIAGRLVAIRLQGKAGFATLLQNGERLQLYVRKDDVGEPTFELYRLLDLGDHIGVSGTLMRTRTGELTLKVGASSDGRPALTFLTKAMLPLPDKHSGLGDIELRYRRRYLDLFTDTGDMGGETGIEPVTPTEDALKGTGFSPSVTDAKEEGASAPEGLADAPPTNLSSRPESAPLADAAERPAGSPATDLTRLPAREVFLKRAAILKSIRKFFDDRNYLEVETPMLHTISGGAAARPFGTHHNALDIPLNLRIAPELYLKRLVIGGLDRVYEINRNFRNEGVSTQHNPEFTMLEFYQAYANYHDLMDLTQKLITTVAKDVNGTTITNFNGTEIDLSKWTKISMKNAIIKWWPLAPELSPTLDTFKNRENLLAWSRKFIESSWTQYFTVTPKGTPLPEPVLQLMKSEEWEKLSSKDATSSEFSQGKYETAVATVIMIEDSRVRNEGQVWGKAVANIFEVIAEIHLIQPHIIYDFPLAVSPLSKVKPDEPEWVERFEFYIGGFEVGNAFSELNDAADQLRRFEAQVADKDPESMAEVDHDYVRALGYGLPPTAGEGIGIDRLTMILTGSRSIRDVILFPLMRPQGKTAAQEAEPAYGELAE